MNYFIKTQNYFSRLHLFFIRFLKQLAEDMVRIARRLLTGTNITTANNINSRSQGSIPESLTKQNNRPIIFVSACVDKSIPGVWKYNGGIKMLNLLVKLLRKHGYESYMVTYDGTYEPWLIEHQPHISIKEFEKLARDNKEIRCVTSWAISKMFIDRCKKVYFWDMELAYSDNDHFSAIYSLYRHKSLRVAGCNSMICSWHMTYWKMPCTLLVDWVDEEFWMSNPQKRDFYKIGYMLESDETENEIGLIKNRVLNKGIDLQFQLIKGSEKECLEAMQTCNVFLGMNHGKDKLWGEGFGLPMMEAMWAGCVVIAFDVIGNREFIQTGYNGIIINQGEIVSMADMLSDLYLNSEKMELLRKNSENTLKICHASETRWSKIKEFLEL